MRKRKKKGSLELSVNSIVILILAITLLGLGIAFIKGMFGKLTTSVWERAAKEPDPEPANSNFPITLSKDKIVMESGGEGFLKVSVYNPSDTDLEAAPYAYCPPDTVTGGSVDFSNATVPARGSAIVTIFFPAAKVSSPVSDLCEITVTLQTVPDPTTYTTGIPVRVIPG